jgi:hypothetical protein
MTTQKAIKSGGENFTLKTYMGIAILVRDLDGYVNVTKMHERATQFVNPNRSKKWVEVVDFWMKKTPAQEPRYVLSDGFGNDVTGIYVHPDLIHFVAHAVSIEYAFTVQKIMNSIDLQLHSIMEDNNLPDEPVVAKKLLDSASIELKCKDEEILRLKKQFEDLTEDYEKLESECYELALENVKNEQGKKKVERKVQRLEQQQFDRDVRTDFCSRRIKVLVDDKKCYHLSSDDKRNYKGLELVREYLFVSGINIRLDVRTWMATQFNRKIDIVPKFSEGEFPVVVAYIE